MTLFERDALAVLLSINTVLWVLFSPLVPIVYTDFNPFQLRTPNIYLTALVWGLVVGALGVAFNHYVAERERGTGRRPNRKR